MQALSTPSGTSIGQIEAVYRNRYGRFVRVATAELRDRDAAMDAVQEAFARAISSRSTYGGRGSLDAWIWRILINVCASSHNVRASQAEAARDISDDPAESDRDLPAVREAVSELPERQRLVLFLRHYADLDYEAIADAVGVERGTVAATLNAARTKLRSRLTEVPHA